MALAELSSELVWVEMLLQTPPLRTLPLALSLPKGAVEIRVGAFSRQVS